MKRFLIATTMLMSASAFTAHADDPQDAVMADDNDLSQAVTEAIDNADLDRDPYTDDHAWIDTAVYGSDGAELGDIECVRLSPEGEVEAIVVEYGGTLEIGGREVLIESADYSVETVIDTDDIDDSEATTADTESRVILAFDSDTFAALPDFNEDAASEYPLSDDDYDDDESEAENDMDTNMSMADESGS